MNVPRIFAYLLATISFFGHSERLSGSFETKLISFQDAYEASKACNLELKQSDFDLFSLNGDLENLTDYSGFEFTSNFDSGLTKNDSSILENGLITPKVESETLSLSNRISSNLQSGGNYTIGIRASHSSVKTDGYDNNSGDYNLSFSFSQPLLKGRAPSKIELKKLKKRIWYHKLKHNSILLETIKSLVPIFNEIEFSKNRFSQSLAALKFAENVHEKDRIFFDEGVIAKSEFESSKHMLLQAQVEYKKAKNDWIVASNSLTSKVHCNKDIFASPIVYEIQNGFDIKPINVNPKLKWLIEENNLDILNKRKEIDLIALEIEQVKERNRDSLNLDLSLSTNSKGEKLSDAMNNLDKFGNNSVQFGLNYSTKLGSSKKARSIKRLNREKSLKVIELHELSKELNGKLISFGARLENALLDIELAASEVLILESKAQVYAKLLTAGEVSKFDYIENEKALRDAIFTHFKAKVAYDNLSLELYTLSNTIPQVE